MVWPGGIGQGLYRRKGVPQGPQRGEDLKFRGNPKMKKDVQGG